MLKTRGIFNLDEKQTLVDQTFNKYQRRHIFLWLSWVSTNFIFFCIQKYKLYELKKELNHQYVLRNILVVGGKFILYKLDLFIRLFLLQAACYTC